MINVSLLKFSCCQKNKTNKLFKKENFFLQKIHYFEYK